MRAARRPAWILFALVMTAGCSTTPHFAHVRAAPAGADCVILLHGVNAGPGSMLAIESHLAGQGYTTVNVGYPSRRYGIADLAQAAITAGLAGCDYADAGKIHYVTQSMGGILLRQAHGTAPLDLGRVVMLAPPNQGSEFIDVADRLPVLRQLAGRSARQLGTRANSVPAQLGPIDFELGVIAGSERSNPFSSAFVPNPDDGVVSVASTCVQGMQDYLVMPFNHHTLRTSSDVIRQVAHFLRYGQFNHAACADCSDVSIAVRRDASCGSVTGADQNRDTRAD